MGNRKIIFWSIAIITLVILAVAIFGFTIKNKETQDSALQVPKMGVSAKAYDACIRKWPAELCKMHSSTERAKLYEICSKAEIPTTELDTGVYPDNKIARVSWEGTTLYLPYEPETEFAGCSESAKSILKHIREAQIP